MIINGKCMLVIKLVAALRKLDKVDGEVLMFFDNAIRIVPRV